MTCPEERDECWCRLVPALPDGWPTDAERRPTTPAECVTVRGVDISSRYQKHDEILTMVKIILSLPVGVGWIKAFWCDSKASASWIVELHEWADEVGHALELAPHFDRALKESRGGYNGLTVGSHHWENSGDWPDADDEPPPAFYYIGRLPRTVVEMEC
jgi:hypothetical protein